TSRISNMQLEQEFAGVDDLAVEVAEGVGDDRPFFCLAVHRAANGRDPGHPGLLHVAEVGGVVDMSQGVHVTPENGNREFMDQDLVLGNVQTHESATPFQPAVMPSSAVMTAPLMKSLCGAHSVTISESR